MITQHCQALTDHSALQSFLNLYEGLDTTLTHPKLRAWQESLPEAIMQGLCFDRWGDLPHWLEAWSALPPVACAQPLLELDWATLQNPNAPLDTAARATLNEALRQLHPWRKGPFKYFDIDIDTEWRSNLKWDRIAPHLDLKGRSILDVGCGNGYYGWRMLGAGAKQVIGIDPSPRFVLQWGSFKKYCPQLPCFVLPLGVEQLPERLGAFDVTFSMGVLYHRKSPFEHLLQLKDTLRPGGQLILETLVIDGCEGMTLLPAERYAKMRNVWLLPSTETLLNWVTRCGFETARVVDVSTTTTQEQRKTQWMQFESLEDFLDPDDPNKTIEGYPAPKRAVILAQKAGA